MSNLNVSELITKLNLTCAAGAEGLAGQINDGTSPDDNTKAKADELGIPILTTPKTAYETAKALAALGV